MKLIKLGGKRSIGKYEYTMIDDEDYDFLSQFGWFTTKHHNGGCYVAGRVYGKKVILHRFIMKAERGQMLDHIDRNPMNNQKSNLRFCTPSQNAINRTPWRRGTSKYMGVYKCVNKDSWKKLDGNITYYESYRWRMEIKTPNGRISKKFPFTSEGEMQAAKYYDELAKIHHGEFAALNFPESNP